MGKKHSNIENHEKDILDDFGKNEELELAKQAASNFIKRDNQINI